MYADYCPSPNSMDAWNIKTPNPLCRLFFKIGLLTDFAALCLTDFIDWRYIHSVACIFDPGCELLPPWMKEQYLCTVAPLLYLLSDLPPPPPIPKLKCTVHFIQTMCVTGGGGWGGDGGCWIVLCRPYSAVVLPSVSGQIQNLQNCYTTPNKWPVKTTLRGWCL
jgi:hypothetical protein